MTTTSETHDTFTIKEQGDVSKDVSPIALRSLAEEYLDACVPNDPHTIIGFLSRPIPIVQGTWQSSSTKGTTLNISTFPNVLFGALSNNINKLDGFVSFKATVKYRVQVNSVPTQAGALMAAYIPYAPYMNSHAQMFMNNTTTDLVASSGCRHVTMNLANSTALELAIPFTGPYASYNLATGQGSFGQIGLSVYSPLVSQTSTSCSYTVLAWFEDVDLRYATSAPLSTQIAQIGSEMKKMEKTGVISSATGEIGRGIAKVLPYVGLSWLSAPTTMLADGAEFVLKALGFSKPSVEAPNVLMKIAPTRFFLNGDGADTAHCLALTSNNCLTTPTGWAGTDEDEMRLDYICARPCYATSFNWATTDIADKQIFQIAVNPLYTQALSTKLANTWVRTTSMPLCAKIATLYSEWRGDLVYTFKVVKTQFHSGRLIVMFKPFEYSDTTRNQLQPAYNYMAELDLSLGTDFTFRVPFVATRPFLLTNYDMDNTLTASDARNCATGTVCISVMNPLIATANVSSAVEVLVEVSMENATFTSPVKPRSLPFGVPNVAQVGATPRIIEAKKPSEVTASNISLLPHGISVGEAALSLRHLLKRNSKVAEIQLNAQAATATLPGQTGTAFTLFPWAPVQPQVGPITATTSNNQKPSYRNVYTYGTTIITQECDMFSNLYPMFAFYRGSMCYRIVVRKKGTNFDSELPINVFINNYTQDSAGAYTPAMQVANPANSGGSYTNLGSGPIQPVYDVAATNAGSSTYQPGFVEDALPIIYNKDGIVEFKVPFYNTSHSCPTTYGLSTPLTMRSMFYPIPQVTVQCDAFVGATVTIYRSVGDDFSFGSLLGCPQHAVWQLMLPPS